MEYKAVFADVDGTLIPAGAHPITKASEQVVSAVRKVQEKGILFSLATARSYRWVCGLTESLRLEAPLICDNGARIYDIRAKSYIRKEFVSQQKVAHVIEIMRLRDFVLHIVDEFENEDRRYIYDFHNNNPIGKVVKMMILNISPEDAHNLCEDLFAVGEVEVTKSISSHDPVMESVHVTDWQATKSKALLWLISHLGLHANEVIGIGDSYNDLEFLRSCGVKAAMGNSVPEILQIADFVAPTFENDGVATVLEKYILGSK